MSDSTENEEWVERLKAEVTASDADPEDLGIVVKSDYEETADENEDLREENEDLREQMEDLNEEVDIVKEAYAEALAEVTGLDVEMLMDRFTVGELREMHEEKVEEDLAQTPVEPDPKSGDVDEEEASDPDDGMAPEEQEREEEIHAALDRLEGETSALARHQREALKEELAELTGEE